MKQLLRTLPAILMLCILFSSTAFTQKKSTPKTLLWRISGNGLTQPSYLYGDLHSTDKELFTLGDSVYAALENSDGFVTEMHIDSLSYGVSKMMEFKREKLVSGILNKEDFKMLSLKMEKITGKKASEITEQDIYNYNSVWNENEMYSGGNKMNTFLYAYLYKHALNMNKWTGGVESLEDHLNMIKQPLTADRIHFIISDKFKNPTYDYHFKEAYLEQDLNRIDSLVKAKPKGMENAFIEERNIKMADRINEIVRQKSSFFIIGVSHLPGNKGLINNLINKGFKMDPVFSNQFIPVDQYNFGNTTDPWETYYDEDGLYKLSLPGIPVLIPNQEMKMIIYTDITSNLNYLVMTKPVAPLNENAQDMFNTILTQQLAKQVVKVNDIKNQNVQGKEIFTKENDAYNRIHVYLQPRGLVWAMVIAQTEEILNSPDVGKFFQSLELILPKQ